MSSVVEISVFEDTPIIDVDCVEIEPRLIVERTGGAVIEPVFDEPVTEPVFEPVIEPVFDRPVFEPVFDRPVFEPVFDEPVTEPVAEEPITGKPVVEELLLEEPVGKEEGDKPV